MKKLANIFLILLSCNVFSQDVQFSNIFANPVYMNPSYTGLTVKHRAGLTYRNQWPGVSKTYSSYMANYDYNCENKHSGIGGYVLQDRTGTSRLINTYGCLNYAYQVKTGMKSQVRAGLLVGFGQKSIDNNKLVFNDQLITGNSISQDAGSINSKTYLDLGVGILYHAYKLDAGFSAKHLNQAEVSMTGGSEKLPVLFSVHGNYRIIIAGEDRLNEKHDQVLTVLGQFRHQLNNNQTELGLNYLVKMLNFGVMYRGVPIDDVKTGYPRNESLAITSGVQIPDKGLKIAYTYDYTVSNLSFNNSKGAHEITCVYEFGKPKEEKPREQKIKKARIKKRNAGTIKKKF